MLKTAPKQLNSKLDVLCLCTRHALGLILRKHSACM